MRLDVSLQRRDYQGDYQTHQPTDLPGRGLARPHRCPPKIWKLSPMDIKSYNLWDEYTRIRDEMFAKTGTLGPRGMWPTPRIKPGPSQ